MGYEVKIIIGKKTPFEDGEGLHEFSVIAQYDLCKVDISELQNAIKGKGAILLSRNDIIETERIFYFEGYNKITEDIYGDELIAFDPQLLLETLIEKRKTDDYRRCSPIIALLESMLHEFPEGFQVVLFGH
jgi:hypothetical protein